MNCSQCNRLMTPVRSQGYEGKHIIFDLGVKDDFGNYSTNDGLVVETFLCSTCGEYRFKAPKSD